MKDFLTTKAPLSRTTIGKLVLLTAIVLTSTTVLAQNTISPDQKLTAIGTSKVWGTVDGIALIGLVQGPSSAEAPLQVACVFEYTEGDIFKAPPALPAAFNGLVHLDEALKGQLTGIRKSGRFAGHALETLLITPPEGAIKAKRLLLIGLGDRNKFTPDLMIAVGAVAVREALTLGVTGFAFASDLKDAGIDSPTALVAGNVVKGIVNAWRTEEYLKGKGLADFTPLTQVYLLAGPAFFDIAGEGIREAIASFNN